MSIRSFALCSALLVTAAPAGAQQFNDWMTPHPGYSVGSGDGSAQYGDARRIAYDNGYNRSFGDKNLYRDMFRNGFADGYRTAYDRYGSNGGYSGGPYYGGRVEPRRDTGWGYPRYPGANRGYGNGSVYGSSYAFQNG